MSRAFILPMRNICSRKCLILSTINITECYHGTERLTGTVRGNLVPWTLLGAFDSTLWVNPAHEVTHQQITSIAEGRPGVRKSTGIDAKA